MFFVKLINDNVQRRKFLYSATLSLAICQDNRDCSEVTNHLCHQFPSVQQECPARCKLCKCSDQKNCSHVTTELCDAFPQIKDKCHKTCGVCKSPLGN